MTLKHLALKDFRNYKQIDLVLNPHITVFVGDNAQGKTNVVEAIYLLSTGRSHRVSDERICIRHHEAFAVCKGQLSANSEIDLKVVLHEKGKTLFFQNQPLKKSSEFIGKMNAVMFSPSDMDLFESSPRARRRMIDIELGKINPVYMDRLLQYVKILKDRNAAFKQNQIDQTYLEVLTNALIEVQLDLIRLKRAFIEDLNQHIQGYYQRLSIDKLSLELVYKGPILKVEDEKKALKDKYEKSYERDQAFKTTHVGVHRDDVSFLLGEHPVTEYASQGQKRMVIVALKCALIEVIETMTGQKPILLLDDVFSELDAKRRKALFEVLHQNTQTCITTTDLNELELWMSEDVTIYDVSQGRIIERSRLT
jgi:DNA replication and repair protein RecF